MEGAIGYRSEGKDSLADMRIGTQRSLSSDLVTLVTQPDDYLRGFFALKYLN